ncbi:UDP-N-acetylmuramoyl-L-alanine--D-glutamate ligase [Pinisolibacter aquiterrae]|uniref:UDP-N-acetylmuramoyl-L-alanine--D-glutamate ligase n=1 Tax=Pinisolibacter aquiterrae TaxID=2815579 RepID=UPI001C3D0EAB|nr:UDP-N-acetylmuramoyl-L-alanine--D-glutamate ligase [Pinisolibacter aquiterrae]MBV5263272.1 UDP-N-acetylmuramoyl-L-alanine--D-glutamate ligase [Pinisolibacter aquiterrae]MCC8237650.1 UDP-N-acetylmuramoyl-L-alanine--D-glutamate ligase [Pinisolibacter aquiterrae]
MIAIQGFRGGTVALFGLGGSGLATARALIAGGTTVVAWDDGEAGRAAAAAVEGLRVTDLAAIDWQAVEALILAPGVPLTHPEPHWTVKAAQAANVPIIGDVELFARERRERCRTAAFVAITGTNGKSTTTALIDHVLRTAGRDAQMGGNIGRAVLSLDELAPSRTYVVECSSFQIDLAPSVDPTVGILTNLSPDHLDRHGTMAAYAAIKERLVEAAQTAVIGVDDALSEGIADLISGEGHRVVRISAARRLSDGVFAEGTRVIVAEGGVERVVADLAGIGSLRGRHNAQNACAAVAAVRALGLDEASIAAGLASFPGLAHRMETVGRRGRVLFVNDSKATNADSTAQALASFDRIHWIVGGKPKAGGIGSLDAFFPKIAKAYLIGVSSDDFAATLEGRVPYERAETIERALAAAARAAAEDGAEEPVVLLSPACASYDQFKNFEVRGDHFRSLVQAMPGISLPGGNGP